MILMSHPLIRSLALVLVIGAIAVPAASARVISDPPSEPPSATEVLTSSPHTLTVVKSSGFDWGDAGIGAGAIGALVLIGLGARLAIGSRGHRSTAGGPTASAA